MYSAKLPNNEQERLERLRRYNILDTPREAAFDRITRIVAETMDVPISLVSLIDQDRQWFKSRYGLDAEETPRDVAFCAHAILDDQVFVVNDAFEDERFHDNPLATNNPNVRFYAGAPLITSEGLKVGTLCAIDHKPHTLSEKHKQLLEDLACLVIDEMELREARDNAVASDKSKSVFLASMSHEIRTPMAGVIGMAELMLDTDLSPQQLSWVSNIKRSGDSLLKILNEILDQSKLEVGKLDISPVDFNLISLVQDTAHLFGSKIEEKGITLNINSDAALPGNIHADSLRIGQILSNFLSNALKFTNTGTIDVQIDHEPMDDDSFMLRIGVTDSGIGLSEEVMGNLFTPFTQADSSISRTYGGTGLGLSISKQLADLMGGDIGAESTVGVGSTFWFTTLCQPTKGEVEVTEKQRSLGQWQASRSLKILVVEDNNINQLLIKAMMDKLTHEVTIAENGQVATELVASSDYDLVLMDIRMPVMDGIEATKVIRSSDTSKSNIPIIALTADISAGNSEGYMNAGMNAVCCKPLDLPKILKTINRLLDEEIHALLPS